MLLYMHTPFVCWLTDRYKERPVPLNSAGPFLVRCRHCVLGSRIVSGASINRKTSCPHILHPCQIFWLFLHICLYSLFFEMLGSRDLRKKIENNHSCQFVLDLLGTSLSVTPTLCFQLIDPCFDFTVLSQAEFLFLTCGFFFIASC